MNETEKEIVAWLRQPVVVAPVGEYWTRLKMAADWIFRPTVAMRIGLFVAASAIERGAHRQHSPATVKED